MSARALGWGVSNVVMRVDVEGAAPFVLKQARERLRTKAHWVGRLDRIWVESAAIELLGTLLPEGAVPRLLFSDPENYLFGMTCAPDDSLVWKERLLAGEADPALAQRAGEILGAIHAGSVGHPALEGRLAGTLDFDQLRIDPFYRTIARVHPGLSGRMAALIASLTAPPARCLVLGDFSPKNILVHAQGLTLVDFETAHAGDPAYDLGFFLSHLLLKAVRAAPREEAYLDLTRTFWNAYLPRAGGARDEGLELRACGHAAACALARIDGKSTVDYLDPPAQEAVRRFACAALVSQPRSWKELLSMAAREMRRKSME